ncbi:flagellin [Arthrobacter sp. RIT-PI-e]|uniref:flagellin n=1 Tax=Arthrobacter sp. RIT-PI-e TaxID=1681197 RepID=UPI001F47930C|nr:hypothetical protein [Arthrobacter sp. RIT-PI-e]
MRVTNQTMMHSAQRSLQTNLVRLADLQDKGSGQRAISRPSDDPAATADSMRVRADLRANEQYGRNITNGEGWLTQLESTMGESKRILDRANDLTLRASNGSMSQNAREATAIEIESLRGELASQANMTYGGRFLFAGNSDAGSAWARISPSPGAAPWSGVSPPTRPSGWTRTAPPCSAAVPGRAARPPSSP